MLYDRTYKINDDISIKIPTVGEILEDSENYYGTVQLITATPYSMMVQLDDVGIDFTTISEWDLFCMMFPEIQKRDTSKIFIDLNLKDFCFATKNDSGEIILYNKNTDLIIDSKIHKQICAYLSEMLHLERENKKPGNEESKRYLIERTRKKQNRLKQKNTKNSELSPIEKYIISLVNTAEFPYNYETVLNITIYQFYASVHQVIKKINYDNTMVGCYAGTIDMKELNMDETFWILS